MFIIKHFQRSFQFSKILNDFDPRFWTYVIYFFILAMMSAFPLNYAIVREQGFRLNFIEESFATETPNWVLPEDCQIRANQLTCTSNQTTILEHQDIYFIINANDSSYQENQKQVLLYQNRIVYNNGQGNSMVGYDYTGFSQDVFRFNEINLLVGQEKQEAYISFGQSLEASFGTYVIFYSLLTNTFVNLGINIIFVLILSLVVQLFRFGYSTFLSYLDCLKFLILSLGLPSLLSLIVGFISPAFSPVVYQIGVGLVVMLVMLFYGKKNFA